MWICSINIDGTELQSLAFIYDESYHPIISPDNLKILYPSSDSTMYIMDSDGNNKKQITDIKYDFDHPHYKTYNFRFINDEKIIVKLKKWYET